MSSYEYFRCLRCGSLTIDPLVIKAIDSGEAVSPRDDAYANEETASALERAFGTSLARFAETILYARTPVRRFLDVRTGHGFLLDSLSLHLPARRDAIFGVEPMPPANHSTHPNYIRGAVASLPGRFDAGSCLDVISALTPMQLRALLAEVATRSNPGAIYIVSAQQPRYVLDEDPKSLDPVRAGHVVSYSLEAAAALAEPLGFRVVALPGRTWAFLLEYSYSDNTPPQDRIWSALPENVGLLRDPERGSVLQVLGQETARAYV